MSWCWNCLFCCCRSSKKSKKNIPAKLKFDNVCNFCGLASKGLIRECKTIAYHEECLTQALEVKSDIEIHCQKSSCPLYIKGVGHTVRFKAGLQYQFEGRWREITTNLLLFSLASCFFFYVIGGNRPSGNSSEYNWLPPFILQSLFVGNLSHLVAIGWDTFWYDLLTVLSLVGAVAVLYYDNVPHIYEFIAGAIVTAMLITTFWIMLKIFECCCDCSKNCCSRCKMTLFRKTYTKHN